MSRSKITLFSAASVITLLVSSSVAQAAKCVLASDSEWRGVHFSTTASLNAAFDANKNALLAQLTFSAERVISALAVDTAQNSTTGEQQATAVQRSTEAYASVVNQQMINEQITQAHADFGPEGQSVDACGSVELVTAVVGALGNYGQHAAGYVTPARIHSAPGAAISGAESIRSRVDLHRSRFCTESEAAAGLCASAGSEPGADVDVATLFDPAASDEAKDAFMNNLIGVPVTKPTGAQARTPEGALAMVKAQRAEAIRSPAIASLAAIRAINERGGDHHGESDQSVADALKEIVSLYGGGPGYEAWHTELGTKNERGLMQELNKLRALSMRLRTFSGDSATRTASIMAALLAAEATNR